jgi:hypothetical protein
MNRAYKRYFFAIGICVIAGIVGALQVYIGNAQGWSNFNNREGYFGTRYLASLLYAINDPYAIHIVAVVWFSYVAGALFLVLTGLGVFQDRDS